MASSSSSAAAAAPGAGSKRRRPSGGGGGGNGDGAGDDPYAGLQLHLAMLASEVQKLAVETLKVAEYLTPILQKQLLG